MDKLRNKFKLSEICIHTPLAIVTRSLAAPKEKISFELIKSDIEKFLEGHVDLSKVMKTVDDVDQTKVLGHSESMRVLSMIISYLRLNLLSGDVGTVDMTAILLDVLIKNCQYRIHILVGKHLFMKTFCSVIKQFLADTRETQRCVGIRLLDILQGWGEAFIIHRKDIYPHIVNAYTKMSKRYQFPRVLNDVNRVPIFLGPINQYEMLETRPSALMINKDEGLYPDRNEEETKEFEPESPHLQRVPAMSPMHHHSMDISLSNLQSPLQQSFAPRTEKVAADVSPLSLNDKNSGKKKLLDNDSPSEETPVIVMSLDTIPSDPAEALSPLVVDTTNLRIPIPSSIYPITGNTTQALTDTPSGTSTAASNLYYGTASTPYFGGLRGRVKSPEEMDESEKLNTLMKTDIQQLLVQMRKDAQHSPMKRGTSPGVDFPSVSDKLFKLIASSTMPSIPSVPSMKNSPSPMQRKKMLDKKEEVQYHLVKDELVKEHSVEVEVEEPHDEIPPMQPSLLIASCDGVLPSPCGTDATGTFTPHEHKVASPLAGTPYDSEAVKHYTSPVSTHMTSSISQFPARSYVSKVDTPVVLGSPSPLVTPVLSPVVPIPSPLAPPPTTTTQISPNLTPKLPLVRCLSDPGISSNPSSPAKNPVASDVQDAVLTSDSLGSGGGGDDPQNTEEGRGKRESTGYVTPSSDPTLTFKYYGIQRVVVKKKESG